MSYKEENILMGAKKSGIPYTLYPVTKAENVLGLDEYIENNFEVGGATAYLELTIETESEIDISNIEITITQGEALVLKEAFGQASTRRFSLASNTEFIVSFGELEGFKIKPDDLIITTGVVNSVVSKTVKYENYKYYVVKIDQKNENPETSVTYHEAAENMTPGSEAWDKLFGYKPCLFKDGAVVGYLNPNNVAEFEDGTPADITSGDAGDVMIEFPRRGVSMETDENDAVIIKFTTGPDDENSSYLAHTRGTERRDVMYIGRYKGWVDSNNKLRSLSGKTPTVSKTITQFRTYAQNNGDGYEQSMFYPLTYRQCLYVLKYKNLNSQEALGMGYVDGTSAQITGATNALGMNYGSTSTTSRVSLFGIEDFWGNVNEWVDGILTNTSGDILTSADNFNSTGTGYENQGQGTMSNMLGYVSKIHGNSKTGFVLKEVSGSASTYFSDSCSLYPDSVASYGGFWLASSGSGVFRQGGGDNVSSVSSALASRLAYL